MLHMFKYKEKFNDTGRHELIHGIKLSDLIAIIDFIRDAFDDILLTLKEQRDRNTDEPVVVQRKDLMSRLSNTTHGNKKDLWNQIKIFTGWTSSKVEIDDGQFKYKIVY